MAVSAEGAVEVYFDGLCEPAFHGGPRNPGGAACGGWVILPHPALPDIGATPYTGYAVFCVGDGATNNVAEYQAALHGLRDLWKLGYRGKVLLRGDSQLVVRQYCGEWRCEAPLLIPLLASLTKAAAHFTELRVTWVPRLQNAAADRQSRLAYAGYLSQRAHERTVSA